MQDGINRRELGFKSLSGLIGGAVGWLPVELATHNHTLTQVQTTANQIAGLIAMALLAGFIGGSIIASETQTLELTAATKRRFLRGFIICFILSLPATYYSNMAFSRILDAGGWGPNHPGSIPFLILARLVGWSLMGVMLGAGVGLASFTLGNVIKGAAGGWVGGFVGGIGFDAIGQILGGLASRLIGFSAVGLCIGLFIGLVHELTKAAWLQVEAGRLRGRQFRLDKAVTTLGRAEENEAGLFGDPAIASRHARIERKGTTFILKDLSIQQGTTLNGQRIENVELHDGDRIGIASYEIVFHLRGASVATSRPASASMTRTAAPAPASPAAVLVASNTSDAPWLADGSGRRFMLRPGGATSLGRALDNDLVLEHPSISRHHARIEAVNGSFNLCDLDSQNGTFVRGEKITRRALADGDLVRFGDAEFIFNV